MSEANLYERIQKKYGQAARQVAEGGPACCGGGAELHGCDPISANLYDEQEKSGLPREALAASLGCGNPSALAHLQPGEVVLDLGSGGGIDVLLSAKRVGPTGKAYGLEMTEEMLALARENQQKAQIENAEFLPGAIENIPLPNESVDVIISNCVINLSADKDRVLAEAFRVLKPGGRFAVSDVVVRGDVPAQVRRNMELWMGCLAGALEEKEYRQKLARVGFQAIALEPSRIYTVDEAGPFLRAAGLDVAAVARQIEGKFMSAFVRAVKPAQKQGAARRLVARRPEAVASRKMPEGQEKHRVLILCTGNSVRSQMAEGLLRHLAESQYEVQSAGTGPIGVSPLAIEVMREIGIDISGQRSKSVAEFRGQHFATVITVCDSAAQVCPRFPGAPRRIHWSIADPGAARGTHEEKLEAFRRIRDELQARLRSFVNSAATA